MGTTGESHRAARGGRVCCLTVAVLAALAGQIASAQDLPRGQVIGEVECQDSPSQHYALYLPSNFTRTRQWPVIIAFDAAARGREGVERYQAAAERYGYIVAGSNNSRNGPWELGLDAAQAMTIDLKKRFPVDSRRLYTAGMSGGARVAIKVALNSDSVAGVLASSAGYAEEFLESVRFPLFGSAGTEDFNYREMHAIDLRMKSPHRVEVFEGGHTWLPIDLATDGVEWMEVQAMKSGLRPRDNGLIDELFVKRLAHAEAQSSNLAKMRALNLIAKDFDGFKDVAAVARSAATLERQPDVADALRAEHEDDLYEGQIANELNRLLRQLGWPEREGVAFVTLKAHVTSLLKAARAADDSAERRMARRALAGLRASSRGIPHADFREFMQQAELPAAAAPPQ
jgi:dienelactone hydrolase